MAGPFVSALANRYGFRLVTIAGSAIATAAFVASLSASSLELLCLTYGIVGGIGFGMIYVPAVITTGFYFEKWRAIATGIAVCGSGIGTFMLAPVEGKLRDHYGWRGTILIQAGLVLNCAVFGCLFRPLRPVPVEAGPELAPLVAPRDGELRKCHSQASVASDGRAGRRSAKTHNNNAYPTAAEALARSSRSLAGSHHADEALRPVEEEDGRREDHEDEDDAARALVQQQQQQHGPASRRGSRRIRTASESSGGGGGGGGAKPFYRDDIFFSASLARLPQYTSQTSVSYHVSVTRLPTTQDLEEQEAGDGRVCTEALRRTLATMLDFSLFKSPTFLVLAVSGFLTMMGFYIPFMFLKERAAKSGMEATLTMFLVSSIGITNTVGRVLCGLLSSVPGTNTLFINNLALTVGGVATVLSGLSMSAGYQFTYTVVFGLAIACFASLRSIIIVDLMGLDNLTNAFGLLLLFQGISATVGSPIAGKFKEATGSYDAAFYMSGSLILVSAILCYPLNRINKWEKERASGRKKAECI
ncbi:monocarboxylate transporter 3 isoform X2 [Bacillus rossius redtenbacheri]